ncbi:sugar O-acetyltransferase [Pseudoruegeria sp. HB172150]|uniref:sugar O-acetyltransferase n=1 Tax=Pseudoruegeria sp. HB172150 TaxID=2721164 RepID=UPI0020A62A10|nr:sugar O-acetyltransferase [Pseudoruegeria sp. HB172150]
MTNALPGVSDGEWYSCLTPELEALRSAAREAVHEHGSMHPVQRGTCGPQLRDVLGSIDDTAMIEAPFHCAYGINLHIGAAAYLNTGCVILDTARVKIGARTMLGPGVHVYCADHHHVPAQRREGLERALPVTIGEDVWIGGRAVILPGVTVGDGALIAAGAVVTRDVAPGAKLAGVPARPIG